MSAAAHRLSLAKSISKTTQVPHNPSPFQRAYKQIPDGNVHVGDVSVPLFFPDLLT